MVVVVVHQGRGRASEQGGGFVRRGVLHGGRSCCCTCSGDGPVCACALVHWCACMHACVFERAKTPPACHLLRHGRGGPGVASHTSPAACTSRRCAAPAACSTCKAHKLPGPPPPTPTPLAARPRLTVAAPCAAWSSTATASLDRLIICAFSSSVRRPCSTHGGGAGRGRRGTAGPALGF